MRVAAVAFVSPSVAGAFPRQTAPEVTAMADENTSGSDPLLRRDPEEDAGAITASLYAFQHHSALRLLLAELLQERDLTLVCETYWR